MATASASSGCGLASGSISSSEDTPMRARRISALVAMMAMLLAGASAAAQPGDQALAERWHQVVGGLEPAAFVSLRLKDGTRVKGTVLGAGDRSFTLMPHTRIPVGSREIP